MALEIVSVGGEAADLLGEAGGQRAAGGRLLTVLAQRALTLLILLYTQEVQSTGTQREQYQYSLFWICSSMKFGTDPDLDPDPRIHTSD
jgi:hypothetical protein